MARSSLQMEILVCFSKLNLQDVTYGVGGEEKLR